MITGAVIALVALLMGIVIGRTVALPSRGLPELSGVGRCGCKHNKAFHNPKTGECHEQITNKSYDSYYIAGEKSKKTIQCPCRQYVGETEIEQIYNTLANAPSILPPKEK